MGAQEQSCREDARLRPRCARGHAAGGGQDFEESRTSIEGFGS